MASFCPIFLPNFIDAQYSPMACMGKNKVLGRFEEKLGKEVARDGRRQRGRIRNSNGG